jgi:acetylornithine deacetylase/succinyl-diaminopimelate desuccinylase-like protein
VPPEWRIYARSASDDKAPVIAVLAAIDALRAANIPLSVNLKFFFEGEEEAGSTHLPAILEKYADRLKGDVWLLCDGPVHQTRRMQVYFGARGITDLEMTVYGPARPLHSGHYGNWAPNPAVVLANLLAGMRGPDGRIRIAGFYDDMRPLTDTEKRAVAEAPDVDAQLKNELGLAWTEGDGKSVTEQIMLPALNVRGIRAGNVGATAQNAISTEASASIDFRLVPNQTPEKVRQRVENHLRQQGFHIVSKTPDMETRRQHPRVIKLEWGAGYPPARTSMELPLSRAVVRLIEDALGAPIVKMPTLGGSVPMYLFLDVLKTPVIGVPIANHDNNQHGANENIRIQNLWDGIEIFAVLLAGLGRAF